MRVVIIGRTEPLYETVISLMAQNLDIAAIITAKAAPEYSKTEKDFEELAKSGNIPFLNSSNRKGNVLDFLKSIGAVDIAISINFPTLISAEAIAYFRLGILNAHGGDLPRYKGNACQDWALLQGDSQIALCIHKMSENLDSGDIIEREYFPVDIDTRIGFIYDLFGKAIPRLFLSAITKLTKNPEYILERQSMRAVDALRCYPREPEDGRISWSDSAVSILRLINASSEPYKGAFCEYKGETLIIWRAKLYLDDERFLAVPGQVCRAEKDAVVVITGKGKLQLLEIEFKGKRIHPFELIRGIRERIK